jgi:AcrR family transcriptional regulator
MAAGRRRGVESSATRAELIEAAATLICEEGYAALTSRTLADRLNLSRKIVHYYFKSIDELLIALVQQRATKTLKLLEDALGSAEPLRAVWEICSNPDQAALSLELNALANRRPAVRAEVRKFAEQFRQIQSDALVRHLQQRGIEPTIKPIVATVILTCLSQVLALENQIDITLGHPETLELVDDCLRAFAQGGTAAVLFPKPRQAGLSRERSVSTRRGSKATLQRERSTRR